MSRARIVLVVAAGLGVLAAAVWQWGERRKDEAVARARESYSAAYRALQKVTFDPASTDCSPQDPAVFAEYEQHRAALTRASAEAAPLLRAGDPRLTSLGQADVILAHFAEQLRKECREKQVRPAEPAPENQPLEPRGRGNPFRPSASAGIPLPGRETIQPRIA